MHYTAACTWLTKSLANQLVGQPAHSSTPRSASPSLSHSLIHSLTAFFPPSLTLPHSPSRLLLICASLFVSSPLSCVTSPSMAPTWSPPALEPRDLHARANKPLSRYDTWWSGCVDKYIHELACMSVWCNLGRGGRTT